jgi:hypothetical protein
VSDYNCGTCDIITCEFHPKNEEAYFVDAADDTVKMYPGVEVVHEFTAMKGCSVHSTFMEPILILEEELKGGQATYMELVESEENGIAYALAAKALTVCLERIARLKRGV